MVGPVVDPHELDGDLVALVAQNSEAATRITVLRLADGATVDEQHTAERGTALGIWGATTAAAVATGPLVGGDLVDALSA